MSDQERLNSIKNRVQSKVNTGEYQLVTKFDLQQRYTSTQQQIKLLRQHRFFIFNEKYFTAEFGRQINEGEKLLLHLDELNYPKPIKNYRELREAPTY